LRFGTHHAGGQPLVPADRALCLLRKGLWACGNVMRAELFPYRVALWSSKGPAA